MNIVIKNKDLNKSEPLKVFNIGSISTTFQDLLDESNIEIEEDQIVVLKIDNDFYFLPLKYKESSIYGFGKDIKEEDLIKINSSFEESINTEINNESTTNAITFISPRKLWYWFKSIILSRNNTWTGNNNFEKNVVIKGESSLIGNALEIRNSNNEPIAEFLNNKRIKLSQIFEIEPAVGLGTLFFRYNNTEIFRASLGTGGSIFQSTLSILEKLRIHANSNAKIELYNDYHYWEIENNTAAGKRFRIKDVTGGNTYPFVILPTSGRIGVSENNPKGIFDVASTTETSLPFPRMTQAQRTAITSPPVGGHVYQTDGTEGVYVYKSTGWQFAY